MVSDGELNVALTIDTGHVISSIRLYGETGLLGEKEWKNDKKVSSLCLEYIDNLLNLNKANMTNVRRVGVFVGPARFQSSLRAGVVIAQMLGLAHNIDLIELNEADIKDLTFNIWSMPATSNLQVKYDVDDVGY